MLIESLRYTLGPENIEGTPREIRIGRRDLGRLLVIDRAASRRSHRRVQDLPSILQAGDVLVLNNSKRIPGVLRARTARGGQVELQFVDFEDDHGGLCRVFPTHDVAPGGELRTAKGVRLEVAAMGLTPYTLARVRTMDRPLRTVLKDEGLAIPGFFYQGHWAPENLNPYYATEEGTVESPLAGLHFTPELVGRLEAAGVLVRFITLHSVGSWLPFLEERTEDHRMWAEPFTVPEETAAAISQARERGTRVVACGSTSLRALESASLPGRRVAATSGRTTLYITPSYAFNVVDAYFTNFHQYQSSLMVLDAAFCGQELLLESYRDASRRGYSFFEFGDAVLYL